MENQREKMDLRIILGILILGVLIYGFNVYRNLPTEAYKEWSAGIERSLEELRVSPALQERYLSKDSENFKPLFDIILQNFTPQYTPKGKEIGITHTKGLVYLVAAGETGNDYELVSGMGAVQDWIELERKVRRKKK